MPQVTELGPGKSDVEQDTKTPKDTATPATFDDLVVDGSLAPVEVRVSPVRTGRKLSPTDDLLIELQCEV